MGQGGPTTSKDWPSSPATAQGSIVLGLTLLFGFHPVSWALVVPAILLMFLVASLFSALGITVASFLTDMQGFQLISW